SLQPMLAQGIDTVALGCTHYPFVIPLIQEIVGDSVRVIDPAPAVARQVERVLRASSLTNRQGSSSELRYLTTGDAARLHILLPRLTGEEGLVDKIEWETIQAAGQG
ncbi:MAG: glutamate racemase, partial [Anaerolineales bacterium]